MRSSPFLFFLNCKQQKTIPYSFVGWQSQDKDVNKFGFP